MSSTAFAFVAATVLMFVFKQTRWMGIVAAFVLLAINPALFTGLLLAAGGGYYLFRRRRPKGAPASRR